MLDRPLPSHYIGKRIAKVIGESTFRIRLGHIHKWMWKCRSGTPV